MTRRLERHSEPYYYAIVEKIAHDAAKKAIINSSKGVQIEDVSIALEENKSMNM